MPCGNLFFCIGTLLSNYINVLYKICYSMRIYYTSLHAICLILCSGYHSCPWAITYTYMFVRNVNCDGRKWAGYAMGGCSCALSWLHMNMPSSAHTQEACPSAAILCSTSRVSSECRGGSPWMCICRQFVRWTAALCALWRWTALGVACLLCRSSSSGLPPEE